ncbi:tetratricopeptide repeat protein [Streptomyces graminofaciens]|uniref:tetratricopeptide repeat protein n=1 Tax=Streptomyces graminofaciens TaxID=68212 RepID=UPI00257396FA|nr:tetratricopeptide repeat protein [Streptomyces graminofaciens]
MGDLGGLFTDRRAALSAVRALAEADSGPRVLLLTGLPGMGKSTLLAYVSSRPPRGWACAVVDAEALVSGMALRSEGAEEAALLVLRAVGGHLAGLGPWWRRRWLRQKASQIGQVRPWRVRVWQWAGFGGRISGSPVEVVAGALTQGQLRGQWADQLLAVARGVRRGRLVLMVDSCERLAYFDDVRAERPRPERPYGVGGWFGTVVDELLALMPHLRVVLAGTTAPAPATAGAAGGRFRQVELKPWRASDTRSYLARRGLEVDAEVAAALTEAEGGLPVSISWIADVLNGPLAERTAGTPPAAQVLARLTAPNTPTGPARAAWLAQHVRFRLSEGTLALLHTAAVLDSFTPTALMTVARTLGPVSDDAFTRLAQTSCISLHTGGAGGQFAPDSRWQVHAVMRRWLIEDARAHDAQQPPARRVLPALHRAAAGHYEALAGDAAWSPEAARHRFATGDGTHAAAWTGRLAAALRATPPDNLQIRLLTDAALDSPGVEKTLPAVVADAHLAAGHLAHRFARYAAAQDHAEQALALYRTLDGRTHAVYVSACLAGQAAWKRPRYQDTVTHWTTALTHHPDRTGTDPATATGPGSLGLRTALAEAALTTGDAPRARTLLERQPPTDPSPSGTPAAAPTDQPGQAVEYALPAPVLGELVPLAQHPAHTHLLHAETAFRLYDHRQAATRAHRILDDSAAGPHQTALAHRLLARIALYTWDIDQAGQHLRDADTAAGQCPDQRCLVHLLLTRAELADRKAIWMPPQESTVLGPTSISVTQRSESAHQYELAYQDRTAAAELADGLNDPLLKALTTTHADPDAALALHRTIGNHLGEADILHTLAATALHRGNLTLANQHATQALTLHHAFGNRHGEADTLRVLASIARDRGDLDLADQRATQALTLYRTIENQYGEAESLDILSIIARDRGDLDLAEQHARQALAFYRTIGNPHGEAVTLRVLADTARHRGDLDLADQRATQALTLYRTIGNQYGEAAVLGTLARIAWQDGRREDARHHMETAAALYDAINLPEQAALCRQQLRKW